MVDIYPRRRVTIYSEATREEVNRNWKEKRKQKEKRGVIYIGQNIQEDIAEILKRKEEI